MKKIVFFLALAMSAIGFVQLLQDDGGHATVSRPMVYAVTSLIGALLALVLSRMKWTMVVRSFPYALGGWMLLLAGGFLFPALSSNSRWVGIGNVLLDVYLPGIAVLMLAIAWVAMRWPKIPLVRLFNLSVLTFALLVLFMFSVNRNGRERLQVVFERGTPSEEMVREVNVERSELQVYQRIFADSSWFGESRSVIPEAGTSRCDGSWAIAAARFGKVLPVFGWGFACLLGMLILWKGMVRAERSAKVPLVYSGIYLLIATIAKALAAFGFSLHRTGDIPILGHNISGILLGYVILGLFMTSTNDRAEDVSEQVQKTQRKDAWCLSRPDACAALRRLDCRFPDE